MKLLIMFLASALMICGCISETAPNEEEDIGPVEEEMMNSKYMAFDKASYLQAKEDNMVIFLEFYANWCPVCKSQEPEIENAFSEINDMNIVGFRVNYKDSDTDKDEVELAREFGITYQHTHVIIKNGEVIEKSQEFWDKERILEALEVS